MLKPQLHRKEVSEYCLGERLRSSHFSDRTPAFSATQPVPEKDWNKILAPIDVGIEVKHKTFGNGTVIWMDKAKKYIRVRFPAGEKQFIFPDAFIGGFLSVE